MAIQHAPVSARRQMRPRRKEVYHHQDDFDADQVAERARQQCIGIVQSHLDEFLLQHPEASFCQWIASLHPENAKDDVLDHRFLNDDNPWLLVWRDTAMATARRK
mmetsp:Transcript_4773/g.6652  ORF Transcript_4773/g.6652 Transcript_4773/m.6652 type:complete len:105 (-) Transcript_4773:222-536(-)|eukprot:CAMPEP_0194032994 /NCGR_PEP_ID=MMETSP0009_2-20130614/5820_1 /TAXON_ID=210454 /ORGANISM="Grammatophora oceanica, Strain CCMP 410" /LENGTH=104 /DNA_ID=CAMNT_0038673593 /DNA_START=69 /DNA_END=383 /DNA_ORIENTATION=+